MGHITLLQAVLISLFYWLMGVSVGYTISVPFTFTPLPAALWVGLILGDVPKAMMVGGALQLVYLGLLQPGGAQPTEPCLAALIACTLAVSTNISTQAAVALAVPIGLLGVQIKNIYIIVNGLIAQIGDKMVEKGNSRGLFISQIIYTSIAKFFILSVPLTLVLYFAMGSLAELTNILPEFIMDGLKLAGAVLPALGFSIIVRQIGRNDLIPYFFAGFFLIQFSGISTIGLALTGAFVAFLHAKFTKKQEPQEDI